MSKRFTDELIIRISQEAETGLSVADICRKQNCREVEFGGMDVPEAKNN